MGEGGEEGKRLLCHSGAKRGTKNVNQKEDGAEFYFIGCDCVKVGKEYPPTNLLDSHTNNNFFSALVFLQQSTGAIINI